MDSNDGMKLGDIVEREGEYLFKPEGSIMSPEQMKEIAKYMEKLE